MVAGQPKRGWCGRTPAPTRGVCSLAKKTDAGVVEQKSVARACVKRVFLARACDKRKATSHESGTHLVNKRVWFFPHLKIKCGTIKVKVPGCDILPIFPFKFDILTSKILI